MIFEVLASPEAQSQIETIAAWWRENREKAPYLFEQELAAASAQLETHPNTGQPVPRPNHPTLRRVLLRKTSFHVYYVVAHEDRRVIIRAVWSARRKHGPELP